MAHCLEIYDEDVTTKGIRIHFWLEQTYIDEDNIERWQTKQFIHSFKALVSGVS